MRRPTSHKDVEFAVDDASGNQRTFRKFDEAAGFAVVVAASGREGVTIDVLIHSKSGAKWWGGDEAVESYKEDPEASVSDRIAITADRQGRVA